MICSSCAIENHIDTTSPVVNRTGRCDRCGRDNVLLFARTHGELYVVFTFSNLIDGKITRTWKILPVSNLDTGLQASSTGRTILQLLRSSGDVDMYTTYIDQFTEASDIDAGDLTPPQKKY